MAIYAEVDGIGRLEFPDGTDPEVIRATVKRVIAEKEPSLVADVAKSAAYAPLKAAVGIAGLPGSMRELAQAGRQKILSYLPDSVGKVDAAIPHMLPFPMNFMPSGGDLRQGIEKLTGPWYDPQSRTAKAADTGVQTALMMGRNWATAPKQAAAVTAGVTGGTEAAGAAMNDNPIMRLLGGLLGGAVPAVSNAVRSRPGQVVRGAIGTPTQAEIDAALAMQAQGRAEGVPLLGTESLDRGHQLASYIRSSPTGNPIMERFLNQRPGQVETAVERGLLAPTGTRRTPADNAATAQKAATDVLTNAERDVSDISKPLYYQAATDRVPEEEIAKLVLQAQRQAQADTTGIVGPTLDEFRKRLTIGGEVTPQKRPLPLTEAPSIFKTIDKAIIDSPQSPIGRTIERASATTQPHGYGDIQPARQMPIQEPPQRMFANDIGTLDRARKYFRDKMDLPPFAADAIPKEGNAALTGLNTQLKSLMEQNSPTWKYGRELYQTLKREDVDPLLAGDIGRLAGRGYDPAAFPPTTRMETVLGDVKVTRPETIRAVAEQLNAVDKKAFPGIVQTHIENQLNAALEKNFPGPNPAAGAKFTKALVGTPTGQANFDEMMRGVAAARGVNPTELVKGANNLLQVLERTGRTPGIGSQTQPRQDIAQELGKTKVGDVAGMISTSPMEPARVRWSDKVRNARNEQIARALTAEDSVQILLKLAKTKPNGITASYYAAVLLGLDEATAGP
jgi:hypothetical protein